MARGKETPILTSGEAAKLLGYSREWFVESILPANRVLREAAFETDGGHLRIPRAAVLAYRSTKMVMGKNPIRFEGEADATASRLAELLMELSELTAGESNLCRGCRKRARDRLAEVDAEEQSARPARLRSVS